MASNIHSTERRLYEKLGMENPNKPLVYTSTVKEGPTIHKVRIVAHDGSKKIPPPVAAKPVFYKATVQAAKVPEKAKPSTASFATGKAPEKKTAAKSMEDELAELTDLLVKNLDNTSDPDFFGKTSTKTIEIYFWRCLTLLNSSYHTCHESQNTLGCHGPILFL